MFCFVLAFRATASLVQMSRAIRHITFQAFELFLSLVSALKAIVLFGIQCRYHLFFSLASKAGVHTHSRILGHHVFLPVDIQSHFSLVVSSRVTTPGICIHWHCAFDFPDSSIHLYLLHPVTLCLPLIHHRLSRFLFIGTWHSPLSSRHMPWSCC